jgi:peptide/nickel transport system ATP-binding protein
MSKPLLKVTGLQAQFLSDHGTRRIKAVDGVSFDLAEGQTLGLVGESGSGKSTLARCIMRLYEPEEGSVTFAGEDVLAANRSELRALRRKIQMVYQDPYSSLNPRLRIGEAVAEPARVHGLIQKGEEEKYAIELLDRVGIRKETVRRYPHEFSGGQRQRIAIARALATSPDLLVCDEAVSALDAHHRAAILALLARLKRERGLALLFVTHDLAAASAVAERIAVLEQGRIVETGGTAAVLANPQHPHTRALVAARPTPARVASA